MNGRRLLTGLLALAALGAAVMPAAAQAGSYRAYLCQLPDGRALPLDFSWQASSSAGGATPFNECATGGGFGVKLHSSDLNPEWSWERYDEAVWTLGLPEATLTSLTVRRTAQLKAPRAGGGDQNGATPVASIEFGEQSGGVETQALESCAYPGCTALGTLGLGNHGNNQRTFTPPAVTDSAELRLAARCTGSTAGGECAASNAGDLRAELRVYRAKLELRDDEAPIASNFSGSLTGDAAVAGAATLSLAASDAGAGVREVSLELAGNEVARQAMGGATCQDVGYSADDAHEYSSVKPCVILGFAEFTVDTRFVPNGTHRLKAIAHDAAGNDAIVLDRQVTVNNPPTPGGGLLGGDGSGQQLGDGSVPGDASASRLSGATLALAKGSRGELRVGYRDARTISGTLVDVAKKPIAGATLKVSEQLRLDGSPWVPAGTVKTDAKGVFTFKLSPLSSRLVRFAIGGTAVEAKVGVLAKMEISASKSIPRRGTLKMSGKVTLDGLPKRGVRVEIQSRWGKTWRTIDAVQSSSKGTWRWKYRMQRATGSVPFRAVLVPGDSVAAAGGTSKTVNVRVR